MVNSRVPEWQSLLSLLGAILLFTQCVDAGLAKTGQGTAGHRAGSRSFAFADDRAGHAGFHNHYDNLGRWGEPGRNRLNDGNWGGWARPHHRWYQYGWGGWSAPYYAAGPGYAYVDYKTQSLDEEGNIAGARSYNLPPIPVPGNASSVMYSDAAADVSAEIKPQEEPEQVEYKPVSTRAKYRLGPDVDVLEDGNIAVHLTDKTFLVVRDSKTLVVEQASGIPVMALATDPVLLFNIARELKRQSLGLHAAMLSRMSTVSSPSTGSAPESNSATALASPAGTDRTGLEIENLEWTIELLNKAKARLGSVPDTPPQPSAGAPDKNALELFAGVWIMKDGSYIVFRRPDRSVVYLNNKGMYEKPGAPPLKVAYPNGFEQSIFVFLKNLISQSDKTLTNLNAHKDDTEWALQQLADVNIGNDGTAGGGASEDDGSTPGERRTADSTAELSEAKRRLAQAISRSERRLNVLTAEINLMPEEVEAARKALDMLEKS